MRLGRFFCLPSPGARELRVSSMFLQAGNHGTVGVHWPLLCSAWHPSARSYPLPPQTLFERSSVTRLMCECMCVCVRSLCSSLGGVSRGCFLGECGESLRSFGEALLWGASEEEEEVAVEHFYFDDGLADCLTTRGSEVVLSKGASLAQASRSWLSDWPCGLMDKALVFGTKDCRFESCQGHTFFARSRQRCLAATVVRQCFE